MPLAPGETLQNRYRIVSLLGQGGMGAVYRAWDLRLAAPVALKEQLPQPGLDAATLGALRRQFEQEATVVARLSHPSLVRVTDFFEERGNAYLVMELLQGESLADRIARQGRLPEAQVLAWARQILDALAYCHSQGIVHRDIKPENIHLRADGRAVLVDFGLVKLWNPADPRTQTVLRGMGTPEYAPPEQYGRIGQTTDPRSDLFSLGATLYHALTGQAPAAVPQRVVNPQALQSVQAVGAKASARTEAALAKALMLVPDERFATAQEMHQALFADATLKTQPAATVPALRPNRRLRLWGCLVAALIVVGGTGVGAARLMEALRREPGGIVPTAPVRVAATATFAATLAPGVGVPTSAPGGGVPVPPAGQASTHVEFILDASNGMMRPWSGGETRWDSARGALAEHWQSLDPAIAIGLRAYGHRRDAFDAATCQDTELLVPVQAGALDLLVAQLGGLQAQGLDSLGEALRQSLADFALSSGGGPSNAIVLITDGAEANNPCGDLAAVVTLVRNQRDTGILLPIFIIGLGVPADQAAHFESMAAWSGGQYQGVDSVLGLQQALARVADILGNSGQ